MKRLVLGLCIALVVALACLDANDSSWAEDCSTMYDVPRAYVSVTYGCSDGRCTPPELFDPELYTRNLELQAQCWLDIYQAAYPTLQVPHPCCAPFGTDAAHPLQIVLDPSCQPSGEWRENSVLHLKTYSCTDSRWWTEDEIMWNAVHAIGICWGGNDSQGSRCIP